MVNMLARPLSTEPVEAGALVQLEPDAWRIREAAHRQWVENASAAHRLRKSRNERHPIEDFLWTYYSVKPSELARWHPGAGVHLLGAASERAGWKYYSELSVDGASEYPDPTSGAAISGSTVSGATVDLAAYFAKRAATVDFVEGLLAATVERTPAYGCFGLHEWAMVHGAGPEEIRHIGLPLRIGHAETDAVVESHPISCSHFDAYRFFTPSAAPMNSLSPTRENQASYEQSGCLHAGMDVYKWATKLGPIIPGELLLDTFRLARDIREVDMRASPYDVTGFTGHDGQMLTPIAIETPSGKLAYAELQRGFSERGNGLRIRVLQAIAHARALATN